MLFQVRQEKGIIIITVKSPVFDESCQTEFLKLLDDLIAKGDVFIDLDVSEVRYIDLAGLSMVTKGMIRANDGGGKFTMINTTPELNFKIAELREQLFAFHDKLMKHLDTFPPKDKSN